MAGRKTKKYVRINDYGDFIMPLEVFERVCDKLFIASTSYEDGADVINELKTPSRITLHDPDEVENVIMHNKLANS